MSLAIVGLTLGAGLIYGASLLNFSTGTISKTYKQLDGEKEITPIDATEPLTILLMGWIWTKQPVGRLGGWS